MLSGQVIAGFGGALVVLQQRLEEDDEHRLRCERRLVEDLDVELARLLRAFHGDVQGDHVRPRAQDAANGRLAVLGECADGIAGVDDLE